MDAGESNPLPPEQGSAAKIVNSGDGLANVDPPSPTPMGSPPGHALAVSHAPPPRHPLPLSPGLPGIDPQGRPTTVRPYGVKSPGEGAGAAFASLGRNALMTGLLGGLVGGILGALLARSLETELYELSFKIDDVEMARNVGAALWVACFAAVLGAVLMAWDGLSTRSGAKALVNGVKGVLAGSLAGFVGGFVAQALYSKMLTNALRPGLDADTSKVILARGVGWAVFGALLGAGIGIPGGGRKILNGLLGGALGGATGGILFQVMENEGTFGTNVLTLQLVGLALTGTGIGVSIGLIETARKESWITVGTGPMAGKEYILYLPRTRVGSDYRCEIVLAKDRSVAPVHLLLERDPQGRIAARPEPGCPLTVNDHPSGGTYLRSGDQLAVGSSLLRFTERAERSSP